MATGTAIWGDQLTANESAQLMRGGGTIPLPRPDVLVVGGGIVGVAAAAALHRAGAGSVLLIEAGRLGSGASGSAAGLLLPEAHAGSDPEPFVTLARSSLGLWKELEQTVPGGVGLIELDWIGLRAGPGGSGGVLIGRQARVNPLRALARLALSGSRWTFTRRSEDGSVRLRRKRNGNPPGAAFCPACSISWDGTR